MAIMTNGLAPADGEFDLDVTLVESAPVISKRDTSEGGCGATCGGHSCTSGVV
ncbi:hypothetical protein GCM10010371_67310 [Streptomyces subrutilus]|uniref:FxLD family lantipeptide n=1 Tax=Streptomyces subrutilus TaxID=36818 RepID=A0A5P2UTS5_9ACTN|nr:FxLD family lanthipeptide [Streptomyces subrutilus]QEU82280.1 FxLD family lantipeptide [Streptomyces subrutilus]GGZ98122.1 hypothetical protein GCM10010371_67310 [Streptomyces subrutilus]